MKAEAEAEHSSRRLAVAQEQIAEYAAQREREAGYILEQVEAVQSKVAAALQQGSGDASSLNDLSAQLQVLPIGKFLLHFNVLK